METATGAVGEDEFIATKYTCDGENVSPPLAFANVPAQTGSLAITITDIDAPEGILCHWLVWNIPPEVDELEEDVLPEGTLVGLNDFGANDYEGPCEKEAEAHRFIITLYSISHPLDLPELTNWEDFHGIVQGMIIEEAELMFLY